MRLGQQAAIGFASRVTQSAIGFGVTLVLTNLLGRETYGGYVLVLSVVSWLVVLSQFGVSSAVGKRISETSTGAAVDRYITLGWIVVGVATALLLCGILLFYGQLNAYIGVQAAGIVAALLIVRSVNMYLSSVLQGQGRVHVSSLMKALESMVLGVVQVGLVVTGYGLLGAFAGYGVASAVVAVVGLAYAHTRVALPTMHDVRSLFKFARYSWLGTIRSQTFLYADTVVLAWYVADNSTIGVYGVAWNVATVFAVFSGSISKALFPRISSLAGEEKERTIESTLQDGLAYGGLVLVPGFVGSIVLGDVVLGLYGEGFDEGYIILLVFVIAQLFYAYANILSNTLGGLDRPDLDFRVNVVLLVSNLSLNVVLGFFYGWYGTAVATATSALLAMILAYGYVDRLVATYVPVTELGRQTVAATLMGLVVAGLRSVLGDSIVVLVPLVGVGAMIYFTTLFGLSPSFREIVSRNMWVDLGWG